MFAHPGYTPLMITAKRLHINSLPQPSTLPVRDRPGVLTAPAAGPAPGPLRKIPRHELEARCVERYRGPVIEAIQDRVLKSGAQNADNQRMLWNL